MKKILVSACLLGKCCKYNGGSNLNQDVAGLMKKIEGDYEPILVCPEVLGGLKTPRMPAEIRGGTTVVTKELVDVTREFLLGAEKTSELAEKNGCKFALLKERSPSCGGKQIYDGSFSGTLIDGEGMTAHLLRQNGVKVYGETELSELKQALY